MDPLRLFNAWYNLVAKAFTEHTLGTAVISIAAIGIFVVLQKEYRPYRLLTNAGFVLLGWIVSITALPFAMLGAAQGWEAAVFDHYQAVASAIAAKVRLRGTASDDSDLVGGSTLHFGVHPGHPYAERVFGIVKRVRTELDAFWQEVAAYNREHPHEPEAATRVTFYFGQSLRRPTEPQRRAAGDPDDPERARE